tara:strand:- start:6808 stop:7392 length:585 start_codon:yes stop_codon:yes gene_type:complete
MAIIAVMGGSFNPPTPYHLLIAERVLSQNLFDEFWFAPSSTHPFAHVQESKRRLAPFNLRTQMLNALFTDTRMQVTPIEQDLPQPTYTYLTLNALKEQYPQHHFYWVLGSDCVNEFPKWGYVDELMGSHSLLIVPRGGVVPNGNPYWARLRHPHMVLSESQFPPVTGSSTDYRRSPDKLPLAIRDLWQAFVGQS